MEVGPENVFTNKAINYDFPSLSSMSSLARELGFLARRNLAQLLDHHSSTGIDWRGLVDKMGFSYEMNMLLSTRESPTLSLLEEWERVLGECVRCEGGSTYQSLGEGAW